MAAPGSILNQISESFEAIGQGVAQEVVQAPKDIAEKALESLGVSSGKKNPTKQQQQQTSPEAPEQANDAQTKRAVARAALEALSGKNPKQKELSVREKNDQEEAQKKEMEKKQREEAARKSLPQSSAKRPRGDLYGKKAKQTNIENKGKRQD